MNVIKKYKEKWQQENVNKSKTAVSRLQWPQDECSSTQNQGGRNGRQQWVAPVCLLPIPQSEDTCWMFSCHTCSDTLEIMSDEIQAIRLTICLSLLLRLTRCSAAQQAGCRRLGDGYARLNRLSLPLCCLPPGQNAAGLGWAQILRVGYVVAQGQQALAQKTWQQLLEGKVQPHTWGFGGSTGGCRWTQYEERHGSSGWMWVLGAASLLSTGVPM